MVIKAIWFDTDGVVVSPPPFSAQYEKEYGVPVSDLLPFFTGPFRNCIIDKADLKEELASWLAKWNWSGTVEEFLHYWFTTEHTLNDQLLATVKQLREQGIICWIMGNQEKYREKYLHEKMQLPQHFDRTIFSINVQAAKPDEQFFLRIYDQVATGIAKDEILYFDDSKKYVDVAQKLGFHARHFTMYADFLQALQDFQINLEAGLDQK